MSMSDEFKSEFLTVEAGKVERVTILDEYTKVQLTNKETGKTYVKYEFPIKAHDQVLKLRVFKPQARIMWDLAGKPEKLKNAVFDVSGVFNDKTKFTDLHFVFINFKDVPNF